MRHCETGALKGSPQSIYTCYYRLFTSKDEVKARGSKLVECLIHELGCELSPGKW